MKVGQDFFAFGHSTGWMITDLAGIRYTTEGPNGKRMILAPKIPTAGKLERVTASMKTPMGTMKSAWTYKEGVLTWSFTVPANTSAEVQVPADIAGVIRGAEAMKQTGTEPGAVLFEAVAGTYTVQSCLSARQPVANRAAALREDAVPRIGGTPSPASIPAK